jgi:hypothetical protein
MGHAAECKDLVQELAGIQHQLETATLDKCSDGNKFNCCSPDDPNSCITIYQAKQDYNNAMAELTILEGLIALGAAIEESHDALKNIKPKQVKEAKSNIDKFMNTFTRANILQKSLEIHGDKSIWDDYRGKDLNDMQAYMNQICVKPKAYKDFCQELAKVQHTQKDLWPDVMKTLQGFSEADRRVLTTDRDKNYRDYNKYLQVNVNGELKPLSSLKDSGEVAKVKELQQLIKKYDETKDKKLLTQLLQKSKVIDDINITFNHGIEVRPKFSTFAKESFGKELQKLHSASGVFLNIEDTKSNFSKVQTILNKELSARKRVIDKDVEDFVSKYMNNGQCVGQDKLECIKKHCKPDPATSRCQQDASNREVISKGLDEVYQKVKTYQQSELMDKTLQSLNQCFTPQQNKARKKLPELPDCIKEKVKHLHGFLDSTLGEKRKALAEKKKVLDFLAQGNPIKKLEVLKAYSVNALHNKSCIKDKINVSGIKSQCDTPEMNQHQTNLVELSDGVQDIVLDYNQKLFKKLMKDDGGYDEDYKKYRTELIVGCESDKNYSHLCKELKKEVMVEQVMSNAPSGLSTIAQINTRAPAKIPRKVDDGPSGWSYVGAGLGSVAIMGVQAWMQMDMQNRYVDSQVNAWEQQSYWNQQWNNWYENQPPMYYNWGYNQWNPGGLYDFNYNNSASIYYDVNSLNYSQLNFATPNYTPGNGTNSLGPSAGTSGYNFGV